MGHRLQITCEDFNHYTHMQGHLGMCRQYSKHPNHNMTMQYAYKSSSNTSRLGRSWTGGLVLVNFVPCVGLPVQVETNSPDHIFAGLHPLVWANLAHCQSVRWCGMQSTDKNICKFMKQKKVFRSNHYWEFKVTSM